MLKKGSAAAKAFMAKLRAAKGKKKPVAKKLGALPIGFEGKVWKTSFKIINQFDIFGKVQSIIEDKNNGSIITIIDGKGNSADKAKQFANYIIMNAPDYTTSTEYKFLYGTILKFCQNLQKEVKEFNKGNKKTIKKQPLNIALPTLKKSSAKKLIAKETPKKSAAKKRFLKTGQSNREYDMRHQALKPGKRISKEGNKYFENRENRSDKGKLLGIGAISEEALALIKDRSELLNNIKFRQIPEMMQEAKLLKGADKAKKLASIKFAKEYIATLKKNITMYKKHI